MKGFELDVFLLQISFITLIGLMLVFFIKTKRSLNYEKHFNKYSLLPIKEKNISFFDSISKTFFSGIHYVSSKLKKKKIINRFTKRYQYYIKYNDNKTKEDIFVIKILIGLLFWLLYLISIVLNIINFNVLTLLSTYLLGFLLPNILFERKLRKERQDIEDNIFNAVVLINNSLKSGKNIIESIRSVYNNLDGVIVDELKLVEKDLAYGIDIKESFKRFYKRVKSPELLYINNVLTIIDDNGANMLKVFAIIEKNLYHKQSIAKEVYDTTKILSFIFKIMLFIPFIFIIVVIIFDKSLLSFLLSSVLGYSIITLITLLYILFILLVKKVIRVQL